MVPKTKFEIATAEAIRFLQKAKELSEAYAKDQARVVAHVAQYGKDTHYWAAPLSSQKAALKRASLDLTKALADIRKYGGLDPLFYEDKETV